MAEVNAGRAEETTWRAWIETEHVMVSRRLGGLYEAIADGLRRAGLKAKLEELEMRKIEIETELSAPCPRQCGCTPGLSEIYRRKVTALAQTLTDPELRTAALETIRGLM